MKTIESFVKKVTTAAPTEPLTAVARAMEHYHVGAVVVTENHRPVGIITDRDLALQLGARGLPPQTPVGQVMSAPLQAVHRDEGVFDVIQTMREYGVRRLPVVDEDGWLVGIVTQDDLLCVFSRQLANLTETIRSEIEVQ